MIIRLLGTALLSVALLTDAAAQTTPAKRRANKSRPARTIQPAKTMLPGAGAVTPADLSESRAERATDMKAQPADKSTPITNNADGRGQGVYAAPGQPVLIKDGPVPPYDGPAAAERKEERAKEEKMRETNTLSPSK